jgi:hypothetical protein
MKGGESIPVSVSPASVCSMNVHPKLSVETATQLAVFLANRPGALARVCDALANAGINIHALAIRYCRSHHCADGVRPSNVEKARRALEEL